MKNDNVDPSSNLDLLRAVAVSCVFCSHFFETLVGHHAVGAMKFGQLGVIMFFVHTSLVLMQSLDRSSLIGHSLVREFLIRRFFRIYPLSVTCVLIAYLVPGSAWSIGQLLANLTLTMNLTYSESMVRGLWTLPLELQTYLVLPFLFIFLRSRTAIWTVAFAIASISLAAAMPAISGRFGVVEYFPCFFGGVIAWRIGRRNQVPAWAFVPAMLLATLPWLLSPGNLMWPRWASCIALGLILPWFRDISFRPVNAVAKFVAKYSYGIYLSHPAALYVAFRMCSEMSLLLQFAIFAALAVAFPLAAFHLIEHPMIRYGKRIMIGNSPKKLAEAAA